MADEPPHPPAARQDPVAGGHPAIRPLPNVLSAPGPARISAREERRRAETERRRRLREEEALLPQFRPFPLSYDEYSGGIPLVSKLGPVTRDGITPNGRLQGEDPDYPVFSTEGYEICGVPNQNGTPCLRVGICPFHPASRLNIPNYERRRPLGPIVKKTWSKEEHLKFLAGLAMFGRGCWKEIAHLLGTRSSSQIQSHAQKFFQRQEHRKDARNCQKRSIHDLSYGEIEAEVQREKIRKLQMEPGFALPRYSVRIERLVQERLRQQSTAAVLWKARNEPKPGKAAQLVVPPSSQQVTQRPQKPLESGGALAIPVLRGMPVNLSLDAPVEPGHAETHVYPRVLPEPDLRDVIEIAGLNYVPAISAEPIRTPVAVPASAHFATHVSTQAPIRFFRDRNNALGYLYMGTTDAYTVQFPGNRTEFSKVFIEP